MDQLPTPWMIFTMEILQLSKRALWERVHQEFEQNVALIALGSFPAIPEENAPDAVVERDVDGGYRVRLLDDWQSSISIKGAYSAMLRNASVDPKTRAYLKTKIQAASWLLDSIANRSRTLEKVTKAIVARQLAFLDNGTEYIKPLKMKLIADEIDVHVTTVSRAVDHKWLQTPHDLLPLRRFFDVL